MDAIIDLLRTVIYWISTFIYKLIIDVYDIFLTLCNSRLLDNGVMEIIAQRVGLILGLIMLFILMFSVIQMILEPDKLTDKEKGVGNIVKKIIIAIVLLGVSQSAFSLLYGVQKTVIESNIIGKFLIPYEADLENFGGALSTQLFTSFYSVDEEVKNSNPTDIDKIGECEIAFEDLMLEISNKNFASGEYCLNEKTNITGNKNKVYIMNLHPLLLPIAGGAALFFLFSYCITIGVRTVQLTFLEIIAPMAIISYLSPKKDTLFSKWWKLYFATYVDVFIRIAIISLAVFLIAVIFSNDMSGTFLDSINGKSGILINVIMIFAILTFAKKAPDLIKDLFPSGASKLGLGFTSPKKLFESMAGWNTIKSVTGNTVGLLGRKTIAGIDSKLHGQNFSDGWKSQKGKFGTWLGKQRETYMPNYNDIYKNRIAGAKEVEQINTKWNKGVEIAKRLMHAGAGTSGSGANAWDKVLNGDAANLGYYQAIFKDDRFIRSKMQVDYNSSIEDDLRRLQQRVNLEGAATAFSHYAGGTITIDGVVYNATNVDKLVENLEKQQKKVEGLKNNHTSISKQCYKDAQTEEQFKYIKNNDVNPTTPTETKTTRGI